MIEGLEQLEGCLPLREVEAVVRRHGEAVFVPKACADGDVGAFAESFDEIASSDYIFNRLKSAIAMCV